MSSTTGAMSRATVRMRSLNMSSLCVSSSLSASTLSEAVKAPESAASRWLSMSSSVSPGILMPSMFVKCLRIFSLSPRANRHSMRLKAVWMSAVPAMMES